MRGAMLVSPITAQAQSDIAGTWKIKDIYQLVKLPNDNRYIFGGEPLGCQSYNGGEVSVPR